MFIEKAILKINPNASFTVVNEDINNIQWHNTTPISIADIEAKIIEVKEEYNSKQYQRNRSKQYPSIQEQLDMQYWDSVNGTTTWKDAITKVKTDNPKE